jgi:hypothetical protein
MSKKIDRILARDLPRLAPAGASDSFNFIDAVLQFLTRWCATYPPGIALGSPAYCCFVGFERMTARITQDSAFTLCSCFREDTPQDLPGKVYFASATLSAVFARTFEMSSFADCQKTINDLAVENRPIVIFNAADRRVLWRADTDDEMREALLRPEVPAKVTSTDFDQILEHFHFEYTASPQGLSKPWYSAPKLLTKPDLENIVRDNLFVYLRFLLQEPFAVFREVVGGAGRADLLVYFHTEKEVFYVELKILRGYTRKGKSRASVSAAKILAWGKEGIAQAFNYKRSNRSVGTAYTCCFDARLADVEMQELIDFAKQLNVEYRRFFMYSSAPLLHAATAGQ